MASHMESCVYHHAWLLVAFGSGEWRLLIGRPGWPGYGHHVTSHDADSAAVDSTRSTRPLIIMMRLIVRSICRPCDYRPGKGCKWTPRHYGPLPPAQLIPSRSPFLVWWASHPMCLAPVLRDQCFWAPFFKDQPSKRLAEDD